MSMHYERGALELYIDYTHLPHGTPGVGPQPRPEGDPLRGTFCGTIFTREDGSEWGSYNSHLLYPAAPGPHCGDKGQICVPPPGGRLSNGRPAPNRVWLVRLPFGRMALRWE